MALLCRLNSDALSLHLGQLLAKRVVLRAVAAAGGLRHLEIPLQLLVALLGLPELLADGLELTHPLLVLAVLGRQPLADQLQVLIAGHQLTQREDDFTKRTRHGLVGEKALLVGGRRPVVLLDARLVQRGRAAARSRVRRGRHTLTQARARLPCLQLDCMQLPGHLLALHRS